MYSNHGVILKRKSSLITNAHNYSLSAMTLIWGNTYWIQIFEIISFIIIIIGYNYQLLLNVALHK